MKFYFNFINKRFPHSINIKLRIFDATFLKYAHFLFYSHINPVFILKISLEFQVTPSIIFLAKLYPIKKSKFKRKLHNFFSIELNLTSFFFTLKRLFDFINWDISSFVLPFSIPQYLDFVIPSIDNSSIYHRRIFNYFIELVWSNNFASIFYVYPINPIII